MIRRPPRSTQSRSSAASDVYKRQHQEQHETVVVRDAEQDAGERVPRRQRIGACDAELSAAACDVGIEVEVRLILEKIFVPTLAVKGAQRHTRISDRRGIVGLLKTQVGLLLEKFALSGQEAPEAVA